MSNKFKHEDLHTNENGITYCNSKLLCYECDNEDCWLAFNAVNEDKMPTHTYEWTEEKYRREIEQYRIEKGDDSK